MEELFKSNKDESPRMFKSDFLDLFSRVHPVVPVIIYLPVITFFIYRAIFVFDIIWYANLGLFFAGIFGWTFFEYILHRFVFHHHPKSKLGKRIHFISHGVHHDFPNDSKRLVMPPGVSMPLAVLVWAAFHFSIGPELAAPTFAGFTLGYLIYDLLHYSVHHLKWDNPYFKHIQKHHMWHHYRNPESGFGFTSKMWDKVFKTDFPKEKDS